MNGVEESDRSILPVNRPNNAEQSAAEAGEGRGRTKENARQSHTLSTQREDRVSQGWPGVRQAARERKRERFTAWLHHLTVKLLRESFYALKRDAAAGVDGLKWREYMKADWRIGWSICTAACTGERIGHSLLGESTYRRPTVGSGRWASPVWRTRSFNRRW
jgi:hypothetical protein